MKNIFMFGIIVLSFYKANSQCLNVIYPLEHLKTKVKVNENKNKFFQKFDLTLSKDLTLTYNENKVYKCEFIKYYDYLIEVFSDDRNYLMITFLPKIKGIASPYILDRGLVLVFDYTMGKKFYVDFSRIKRIIDKDTFELSKDELDSFMLKRIDVENKKMKLLQGGVKVKEIELELNEW